MTFVTVATWLCKIEITMKMKYEVLFKDRLLLEFVRKNVGKML